MNTYEIFNRKVVRTILMNDAESFATQPSEWVKANLETAYISINCWLNLIDQVSAITAARLGDELKQQGLVYSINKASALADAIVKEDDINYDHTWSHYLQTLLDDDYVNMGICLQGLRFLKRFSPTKSDKIIQGSLDAFYELNKRLGEPYCECDFAQTARFWDLVRFFEDRWSWVEDFDFTDNHLMDHLAEFSNGSAHVLAIQRHSDGSNSVMTTSSYGSVSHPTIKCQYDKVRALCEHFPNYSLTLQGGDTFLTYSGLQDEDVKAFRPMKEAKEVISVDYILKRSLINCPSVDYSPDHQIGELTSSISLIQGVEKSLLKGRIIGIEHFATNWFANAHRKLLELYTDSNMIGIINYKDQSVNALAATVASVDHELASVDHTNASDSWSYDVTKTLLPVKYGDICSSIRSKYLLDRETGIIRKSNIWLTSGHPLTYLHESYNFLYLLEYATDMTDALLPDEEPCARPFTCGDDAFIDSRALDTYIWLAGKLNLSISESKSFSGTSRFRESCGVEAFDGFDVSGKKWPRSTINPSSIEGLCSLIDLQHSLYDNYAVQGFLTEYIREKQPGMTASFAYTNSTDLWSNEEEVVLKPDPYKGVPGVSFLRTWSSLTEAQRRSLLFETRKREQDLTNLVLPSGTYRKAELLCGKYGRPSFLSLAPSDKLRLICGGCGINCPQSLAFSYDRITFGKKVVSPAWIPWGACPYMQDPTEPAHWKSVVRFRDMGETYSQAWETYLYVRFLREGPQYEDELLRSLGVSSPIPHYRGSLMGVKSMSSEISK